MDVNLLEESTLGLFMEDSSMSEEIKQTIQQLAHAAMQNQKIELSDVLKVIKQDSIQEAEEALLVSEELRAEREQANAQAQEKAKADMQQKAQDWEREKIQIEHDNTIAEIDAKGNWDIQKQAMLSMGFDPNKDQDEDGVPDVLEVARYGVDAEMYSINGVESILSGLNKAPDQPVTLNEFLTQLDWYDQYSSTKFSNLWPNEYQLITQHLT
jgi:hypothetical protein